MRDGGCVFFWWLVFGWCCVLFSILGSFFGNFVEDDGYWVRLSIVRFKIVHFLGLIADPSIADEEQESSIVFWKIL